jgi:hypothetical protein
MRILIGGDSYATGEVQGWSAHLKSLLVERQPDVHHNRTMKIVATGGSSIDHGLYRIESAMQKNRYSHLIVSVTHPLRFWHRAIQDRPWLASRYAEPRIQGFLREFADLPDWAERQARSVIRSYHSLSECGVRVAVLLPFADELDIPRWRQLGLIPADTENFWMVPIDINRIRLGWNSDEEPNHLPEWCRLAMVTLFNRWIENNSRDMQGFKELVHTW